MTGTAAKGTTKAPTKGATKGATKRATKRATKAPEDEENASTPAATRAARGGANAASEFPRLGGNRWVVRGGGIPLPIGALVPMAMPFSYRYEVEEPNGTRVATAFVRIKGLRGVYAVFENGPSGPEVFRASSVRRAVTSGAHDVGVKDDRQAFGLVEPCGPLADHGAAFNLKGPDGAIVAVAYDATFEESLWERIKSRFVGLASYVVRAGTDPEGRAFARFAGGGVGQNEVSVNGIPFLGGGLTQTEFEVERLDGDLDSRLLLTAVLMASDREIDDGDDGDV